MLVAPIDKLEVADPLKVPFAADEGKVRTPFKLKVFPLRSTMPFVNVPEVETVTFPPSVTVPKLARLTTKLPSVKGAAVGVIVPKAPVPPIFKLELAPPVIVPAPVKVPFSDKVKVLVVLS